MGDRNPHSSRAGTALPLAYENGVFYKKFENRHDFWTTSSQPITLSAGSDLPPWLTLVQDETDTDSWILTGKAPLTLLKKLK